MSTETRFFVTREFDWQIRGEIRKHKDYLVGVRYPAIDGGPYCGPNPDRVDWTEKLEDASSWSSEEDAAVVARKTRDTQAKVVCRTTETRLVA
jgi:hypothetical protein